MVVGPKERENCGVLVHGRTLAAFDKVVENPDKYKRFMKNEEALQWMKKVAEDRCNM